MNTTLMVISIIAGVVVVLGGIGTLSRSIWRVASVLHDNTGAIKQLTARFDDLGTTTNAQFGKLSDRVYQLEMREYGRHPADEQPGAPDHYPPVT